jgi:FKBP-type peptidyl-prolyl cis-trans isomerase 2
MVVGEGVNRPRMAHLCSIIYKAYFYDHTIFDESHGKEIEMYLGDIAWPEGIWRGIQEMRKGETAKIRMKKKYAFGRPGEVDKLRFPKCALEGPMAEEIMTKMKTKSLIYEVTLVSWIERTDVDANGQVFK